MRSRVIAYRVRALEGPVRRAEIIRNMEGNTMHWLPYLLVGGFLKGYRTQVLGFSAFLSGLAMWLVGDMSTVEFIQQIPLMLSGLGLAALGAKVNTAAKTGDVN